MYEKITKQKATEIATDLLSRKINGYSEAVINKNWEADLIDTNNGNAELRVYERLDDHQGFILSRIFSCSNKVENIATTLMEHINACIEEWIAEGLISNGSALGDSKAG